MFTEQDIMVVQEQHKDRMREAAQAWLVKEARLANKKSVGQIFSKLLYRNNEDKLDGVNEESCNVSSTLPTATA